MLPGKGGSYKRCRSSNIRGSAHEILERAEGIRKLIRVIDRPWFRFGCIAAAFFMAVTLFVGAEEAGKAQLFPAPWDKLAHCVYYGAMAVLLAHGFGRRRVWAALIIVPLIGALDEWHQLHVPGRDGSVLDWAADVAGMAVAVFAYRWWVGPCPRDTGRRP